MPLAHPLYADRGLETPRWSEGVWRSSPLFEIWNSSIQYGSIGRDAIGEGHSGGVHLGEVQLRGVHSGGVQLVVAIETGAVVRGTIGRARREGDGQPAQQTSWRRWPGSSCACVRSPSPRML